MSPTNSIGIRTYEMRGVGPRYLSHLLETIRGQKFTDYEVCISDHSKNDEILELCGEYANYFTVKYFKNEENRGNCSVTSTLQLRCVRVGLPNSSSWMICSLIHMHLLKLIMPMSQHTVIGVSMDLHTLVMVHLMKDGRFHGGQT